MGWIQTGGERKRADLKCKVLDYLNVKVKPRNLHLHPLACLSVSMQYCMCFFTLCCVAWIRFEFVKTYVNFVIMLILLCCQERILSTYFFKICFFFTFGGKYLKEQIVYYVKLTYILKFMCYSWVQIVHCY